MHSTVREHAQVQLRLLKNLGQKPPAVLTRGQKIAQWLKRNWLFTTIFILPTVICAFYVTFLASDIYVSEAKYVVRTPADSAAAGNPLSGIVQSTGISKSTDDAHAINTFLISRDAMEILRQQTGLDESYSKGDFIARFPRFMAKRTSESQFKYFQSMTNVRYDKTTAISTLSVSAFDPATAQKIARKLMESGEDMANRLTTRMRDDLIRSADEEADQARARTQQVQQRLTDWRNRESQIDPTRFSAAIVEVVARLSLELAQLRANRAEIQKASPQSPTLVSLQNRIAALEEQIENEKRSLAGSTGSMAGKIVEYELLLLDKTMAERLLAATISAQETARSDAQRQRIYLETIVAPQLPDYPKYPQRLLTLGIVALVAWLSYMILNKIAANIAKHGAFARYFQRRGAP